jgi:hypothetical protein
MENTAEEGTDLQILDPEGVADTGAAEDQGEEEVIVSIGEVAPPHEEEAKAPEWVRELRKKNREDTKRIKELEEKLKSVTAEPAPTVGKKPTLEDFDFDSDKFEAALGEWFETKRKADEAAKAAKKAEEDASADWQAKLEGYAKAKTELKFADYDDAEADAMGSLNVTQQGIVIQGSENPALVIYALGKHPEQRNSLASIKDPVKFAFAIAKLEVQLKVTKRNTPPPPEKVITGTGRTAGTVDSTLERLEAEAEKTGDRTKITRYKAELRAKNRK